MGWEETAKNERERVLALIPEEWRVPPPPPAEQQRDVSGEYIAKYLSAREVEITKTDAPEIVSKAVSGTWTALEIAKAFAHRAAIAHQLVHCLHEIFFDQAFESAAALDAHLKRTGKPVGPLHGLPVSLKDQLHVRGVGTHMGYVGWIDTFQGQKGTGKEKVFESYLTEALRSAGAVLYVKTSVPHTLMCGETVNNIIGYTINPTNRFLAAGGSSGGEGALIAAGGSPLGFGTDLGGSIRIPAAFNGLYGLRPSIGRIPYQGMANTFDGSPAMLSVVGPLARSAASLKLVTQAVLSQQPWWHDPLVHELPWREEPAAEVVRLSKAGKLVFGVFRHDGQCGLHPPMRRAIDLVVKAVQAAGHEVVDWEPTPSHAEMFSVISEAWKIDGGRDVKKDFDLSGEPRAQQIMVDAQESPEYTATDIMRFMVTKREMGKGYMEYWNSTAGKTKSGRAVDAIISPLAPFAACRPERYSYLGYSSWVNFLDYTSVVVPVTRCDKAVDVKDENYKALPNEWDQETHENYDPEIYHGARVAVQLVGRRLQEEKMIAMAEYVGGLLGNEVVA